jgi:hypothetical protein
LQIFGFVLGRRLHLVGLDHSGDLGALDLAVLIELPAGADRNDRRCQRADLHQAPARRLALFADQALDGGAADVARRLDRCRCAFGGKRSLVDADLARGCELGLHVDHARRLERCRRRWIGEHGELRPTVAQANHIAVLDLGAAFDARAVDVDAVAAIEVGEPEAVARVLIGFEPRMLAADRVFAGFDHEPATRIATRRQSLLELGGSEAAFLIGLRSRQEADDDAFHIDLSCVWQPNDFGDGRKVEGYR